MEITVKTLPHNEQRYDTVGDYWIEKGIMLIRVSDMKNEDYAFLVSLHEQIEAYLTFKRGIKEPDIMAFDIEHSDCDDPGSLPDAPYYKEHLFATAIEMLVAEQLNVNWQEYDKAILEVTR